jgi:hypothetical protein
MADLTLHIQLPLEARRELVLQGLEDHRTPEGEATYLLIELLRRAAARRTRQQAKALGEEVPAS